MRIFCCGINLNKKKRRVCDLSFFFFCIMCIVGGDLVYGDFV